MKTTARILGCGLVDGIGIAGSRGTNARWDRLECAAPGTGRTMRAVFDKSDATFRRLDLPSRALVLACEAANLPALLDAEQRQETALLIETDVGALVADLRFSASLGEEVVAAGAFPYTLTSTTLGEVALRYGLRGPTASLSVSDHHEDRTGESLREALRLFHTGEVRHAVVGVVDALPDAMLGHTAHMRAVVTVLAADDDRPAGSAVGIASLSWRDSADQPFTRLAAHCRHPRP